MKNNLKEKIYIKITGMFTAALAMLFVLTGCEIGNDAKNGTTVVCTIFPVYDWVREVTKDCDDINVILLEDNGTDMHSYQPSIKDFAQIEDCDVFIFVGGESEEWAKEYCEEHPGSKRTDICLMEEISGYVLEETDEGIIVSEEEECEEVENDEHIWLSVKRSIMCVNAIGKALSDKTTSTDVLNKNIETYSKKLSDLDKEYTEYFASNDRKLIVADRFPFRYLSEDYDIDYLAAFPGCSAEAYVSFETVVALADGFAKTDEKVVYITESGDEEFAKSVAEEAGKDTNIKVLDSIQSVTKSRIDEGITYYDLMKDNLDVIRQE